MDESGISEDEDEQGQDIGVNDDGEEGIVSSEEGDMDEEEEDSSDMDASDCDKKRTEFIEEIVDLENQFCILREQLYRERYSSVEAKLEQVRNGTAPDYLVPLKELKLQRETRVEVASIQRDLSLANIKCKYEAENRAAHQNFVSEKELLFDSIKAELEEKIRNLEEDKNNVDFSSGLWEQSVSSIKTPKMRRFDMLDLDRRKKPVSVSGPFIIYMIKDSDLMEDWALIKKSLQQQRAKKHD